MQIHETESKNLLIEILTTRELLKDLYNEKGPNSSDYISLSVKHNVLIDQYFEKKQRDGSSASSAPKNEA
ncbi:hypothetical protein [Neobacillus sp. D3-1R]|uniref:hypothetical protein n=1 Tax=Neobacillus sp. D3-1R TaxID=3445778 RepID=UPI003F9FDE30